MHLFSDIEFLLWGHHKQASDSMWWEGARSWEWLNFPTRSSAASYLSCQSPSYLRALAFPTPVPCLHSHPHPAQVTQKLPAPCSFIPVLGTLA